MSWVITVLKVWRHWKKTGVFSYMIAAEDKDALQTNSLKFNPGKDHTGGWKEPDAVLIDGIGTTTLKTNAKTKKNELKGTGFAWLIAQVLLGDKADDYRPTPHFGITYGDVQCSKDLADCETVEDYLNVVVDKYYGWFPDGVKYTSWDGKNMDITPIEWAGMMFECAYMQRWEGDTTTLNDLITKYKIEVPE